MIIKTIAVGNAEEGFIESSISEGCNIISSDDNNRGKTIVIQGALYALGNTPVFPGSFNYTDYYYIVEIMEGDQIYWICRKGSGFIVLCNGNIHLFETISEMKRFWVKNIYPMPVISKNNVQRICDPELFVQLFFVGQDKKDTSNIYNRGFYNKSDFYNMLFSYAGIVGQFMDQSELDSIKQRIQDLKEERATITKEHKILKSKKKSVTYLSSISDLEGFKRKLDDMEVVQDRITELRKERNACASRKSRWERTIKELRSLNRAIDTGELRCMDCNSTNIMYKAGKKESFSFDVSNNDMRRQIIDSIQDKVESYSEEIERLTNQINEQQIILQSIMEDEDISLETIVAYKSQIRDASDAERKIREIDEKITELENEIKMAEDSVENLKDKQENLIKRIIDEMQRFYNKVDPNGNLLFDDIFSKPGTVYSGSDATMFYLSKMYSFARVLKHDLPIIIDSFRAEDLSTAKEEIALQEFKTLGNQIIISTTTKAEEIGKYDGYDWVNHIDYSDHIPSKLLEPQYGDKIKDLLSQFAL